MKKSKRNSNGKRSPKKRSTNRNPVAYWYNGKAYTARDLSRHLGITKQQAWKMGNTKLSKAPLTNWDKEGLTLEDIFRNNLREEMHRQKLTPTELGKLSGMSKSMVTNTLTYEGTISLHNIDKIIHDGLGFGVDEAWLMFTTPDEKELLGYA